MILLLINNNKNIKRKNKLAKSIDNETLSNTIGL